ncbi:TetR/AcrR family transcriptional regulator [Rhodococcus zopfii]|uniref:TetR/AcrR family transcriptional regulator n=1 Tax=Rhodococcus zopfii TaxID=43772 RepID=UPI000932AEBB|nr:TetR/AcrR family transcriptional regulator [Rhodococcus zopfii]
MPKISAATVVEHRAAQRRALLDAAREYLAETPDRAPSLGDVAVRAGLARTSIYHYFGSRDDLLRAVVEDMFPRWSARIVAAMSAVAEPAERVLAYIEVNLQLVADGEHAIVGALATFTPQAFTNERMHAMHEELVLPLLDALREQGRPDPELTAEFINALVYKGTELIEAGRSLDEVLGTIRNLAALGSERTAL